MPTYLTLWRWTEQGARNPAGTVERAGMFKADVEGRGGKVLAFMWTHGRWDGFVLTEAPDEQTATASLLRVGSLGNVRTETLRAFNEEEMKQIIEKV